MTPLARIFLLFALLVAGFSFGFAPVRADELPEDTNKIESLTPEQARRLAKEFPGVEVAGGSRGQSLADCLPLNGLKALDAETAKALAGYVRGPLLLNGLTTLDAATAKELAEYRGQGMFLSGLTTLDADTAKALAEPKGNYLFLNGLTALDADTAKALAANRRWDGDLSAVTALDSPDSVAIAQALATRKGPLKLPTLKKISPRTLSALVAKEGVEIPLIETLALIPEPDGSVTEDFVIPEWLEERQKQKSGVQAAE